MLIFSYRVIPAYNVHPKLMVMIQCRPVFPAIFLALIVQDLLTHNVLAAKLMIIQKLLLVNVENVQQDYMEISPIRNVFIVMLLVQIVLDQPKLIVQNVNQLISFTKQILTLVRNVIQLVNYVMGLLIKTVFNAWQNIYLLRTKELALNNALTSIIQTKTTRFA